MSRLSKARAAQGYVNTSIERCCAGCASLRWPRLMRQCDFSCALGRFPVRLDGWCDSYTPGMGEATEKPRRSGA